MRSLRPFQTFLFTKMFHTHKKHKAHINKQKQRHFYVHKKHLRGKNRLFAYLRAFLCFLRFLCFLCFLCLQNLFVKKKQKKNCPNDLIYITTEFILLLKWSFFCNLFFFITIVFNYHNLFQLSPSFLIFLQLVTLSLWK